MAGERNKERLGSYRKVNQPNLTQQDCMKLEGACERCPNKLEESRCQTYKTPEVKKFMRLSVYNKALYLKKLDE